MSDPCTLCHLHEKLLRWSICEYCKRDIEDNGGSLLKYRDVHQELSPNLSSQSTREVPAQNRRPPNAKPKKQKTEVLSPTAQIKSGVAYGMSAKMKSARTATLSLLTCTRIRSCRKSRDSFQPVKLLLVRKVVV